MTHWCHACIYFFNGRGDDATVIDAATDKGRRHGRPWRQKKPEFSVSDGEKGTVFVSREDKNLVAVIGRS